MLRDGTTPNVDLGDILGQQYKNIILRYKFVNDELVSVFPQVR